MGRNHRRTPDRGHVVAIAAASNAVDQRCLGGYERSQMISSAIGKPIPNDPPMTNAIAKSKPSPARNSCHDMPLLPQGRCPRIPIIWACCVDDSRPDVVLRLAQRLQHEVSVSLSPVGRDGWRGAHYEAKLSATYSSRAFLHCMMTQCLRGDDLSHGGIWSTGVR